MPPAPDLPGPILEGIVHFNDRDYFEAHEAWEDHWGFGPPAERALVLGLIKAAVALHHLRNGNENGFKWQLEKALPLLRENAHVWPALDTPALADTLESVAAQLSFKGEVPLEEYPVIPLEGA